MVCLSSNSLILIFSSFQEAIIIHGYYQSLNEFLHVQLLIFILIIIV